MPTPIRRRAFLARTAAGFVILENSRSVWSAAANDKLNIALVGVGGRGSWFVGCIPGLGENVVAMCDVNDRRAAKSFARIPKARRFHDFRRMLAEMDKEIDAVVVATPDNTHAVITAAAMNMGKHVYCEKPLTRSIHEARALRQKAAEGEAATQMGNQGTASPAYRRAVEVVQEGAIGEVREVHVWNTNGGVGPRRSPEGSQPVPDHLKWDLWLGPAADRPFHEAWMGWHGWREFGTGNLGNWASHTANLPFRALKIDALWKEPSSDRSRIKVTARASHVGPYAFPRWEVIRYEIPERAGLPPVTLTWYNGPGKAPEIRERAEEIMGRKLDWGDAGDKKWADFAGTLLVGAKGSLHSTGHNTSFSLIPEESFAGMSGPPRRLSRSPGHEKEWIADCKGGPEALSNFGYAGCLTEFVLLGNVATQFEETLEFDPAAMKIVNNDKADRLLSREYRPGWHL